MKRYIYHIITVFAAFMVANSAWGQTNRGTLPDPDELNEDLSSGIYTLTKNYKPGSQKRWRVASGRNVIIDLNGHTIDGGNIGRTIFNIASGTLTIRDSKGSGVIKNSTKSCFYVAPSSGATSILNFEGGTIENCAPSDGNGGAMDIQPNGTVNMSGGLITKCKGTSGAAVYVTGGTFNMTGGEIKGNKVNAYTSWTPPTGAEDIPTSSNTTSTRGGGIYVEKGKCTVSGGTISGNVAHSGGGVFVTSGATFSFTGGTIEGNYAVSKLGEGTGNGGGIYIEGGNSNCTINGGTIKNNRATRYGGGININGSTMTIPNCTISGNLASSGGGISMETAGSTLNLQGCTVKENIAKISSKDPNGAGKGGGGGIFLVNGTLNMSGANKIQTNHSYELGGGVYLKTGTVDISGGTSTFTMNDSEISGGAIYLADGNITVAKDATLTVGSSSTNGNTATTNGGGIYCNGTITINGTTNIKYNSATNGGGIYCNKAISLKGASTIDYNSATEKGGGIYCAAQVDVTGDSQMSHNSAKDGGAAYVTGNNLNLAKCTAEYNESTQDGGAFYVVKGSITFNGAATISNNTAKYKGGAAYINEGSINTAEGEIETQLLNNRTIGDASNTRASGGAFYIIGTAGSKAYLNLRGKTVFNGNQAHYNGGAITLSNGNVSITGLSTTFSSNSAGYRGGAVYVTDGDFTATNASTVTTLTQNSSTNNGGAVFVTGGNFTTQGSISITDNYAEGNGGAIYVTDGNITIAKPTVTGNGKNAGTAVTKNGGAIYVTGTGASFTTSGTCEISSNAATTSGGAVYVNGGTLTTASTATIEDNYASTNGGAFYVTGGYVKMKNANINSNGKNGQTVTTENGGAIYVIGDGLGFEATGTAKFNSNAAKTNGGAVYVEGGSLKLAANEIKSNSANDGGAFYVTGGAVSMSGKSDMTGNSATNYGGVAYVNEGSITTAEGDVVTTLSENSATSGGGFYVNGTSSKRGSVTLQGKTNLTKNNVSKNGGAVCVNNGDLRILKDAAIDNNSAKHGGAFYVTNGNITTSKGSISKNTADVEEGDGGAFYVNQGEVTLGNIVMDSNQAFNGGAIALYNGTFSLNNSSQIKNNAATYGGGLYVNNTAAHKAITCTGGSFLKNTAQLGGGIYASGDITLTFAANVEENLAQNGGGLYLDNGIEMMFGNGLIVKNRAEVASDAARTGEVSGVGGGIYLAKGTLSFTERENLGIYNNVASFQAADIYSSGTETTVKLPYVKGMNLKGFDVPGSELYWVLDWHESNPVNNRFGRYEEALTNLNINIEDMIVPFDAGEIENKYKSIDYETCLDLGYDLVYVYLKPVGLREGDNSALDISYLKDGSPVVYRTVLLVGKDRLTEEENNYVIVGLPSGNWSFTPDGWASKYNDVVAVQPSHDNAYSITSSKEKPIEAKYINIMRVKRSDNTYYINNQNITFTYTDKENVKNAVTFEVKKVNKMYPGGAPATQN